MAEVLILGCGFTGSRVAQLLRAQGHNVTCTTRSGSVAFHVDNPESLAALGPLLTPETLVLHSIPVPGAVPALLQHPPARVVYLSTTGVYGGTQVVDERTPIAPRTARELLRATEEAAVANGPWSALVLRPAAIYGPGRGIHASLRAGSYRLLEGGENFVSRIHVDDLAALAAAALFSGITGAFPVADREPCRSRRIAEYCCALLGIPMPEAAAPDSLGETRRADRRVDGSAIFQLLQVPLQYPTYREGIAACLEAEARAFSTS